MKAAASTACTTSRGRGAATKTKAPLQPHTAHAPPPSAAAARPVTPGTRPWRARCRSTPATELRVARRPAGVLEGSGSRRAARLPALACPPFYGVVRSPPAGRAFAIFESVALLSPLASCRGRRLGFSDSAAAA